MQSKANDTILRFNPTSMSREYGSNIYITKAGVTNRIQYRTRLIYAGMFMNEYPIFHLYKQDIYINQTEADEHSYRLAQACSKVFYPIVVICNRKGQIYGIRNDLIQQRWNDSKVMIQREFIGEYAKKYIQQTERNILNRDKILDLVNKDLFFQSFFSLQYGYRKDIEVAIEDKKSFLGFRSPLAIKGIQKASVQDDVIFVSQEGQIIEDRTFNYADVLGKFSSEGYGKIKGSLSIRYKLDIDQQLIKAINVDATLNKDDDTDLINIEMKSHYLSEYPLENIIDTDTIALGEQIQKEQATVAKQNQKSLWKRFQDYLNSPI